MNINLTLSPAPTIANKILVIIYKASNPTVVVDYREIDAPHNNPVEITFFDQPPVTFIVNTHESTGFPNLGTLLHSFMYDATFQGVTIRIPLFISMAAPFVGTSQYENASLIGWNIESIERVPQGTQFVGKKIALNVGGDGWSLLTPGDVFAEDEEWVVRFVPIVSVANPIFMSPDIINAVVILSVNTSLLNADRNKLFSLQGASSVFTVTLPQGSTVDSMAVYYFNSKGGSHVNVRISAFAGDNIEGDTDLVLGQRENVALLWDGGAWIIINSNLKYMEGMIIDDYWTARNGHLATVQRQNWIYADGSLISRTVFLRLMKMFNTLDPDMITATDADWLDTSTDPATGKPRNNMGKWSPGDGATTIRIPRLYTAGYLKAVNSIEKASTFKNETVGDHAHETDNGSMGSSAFGQGTIVRPNMGIFTSVGNLRSALTNLVFRTNLVPAGKTEPDHFGIYKQIFI